MCALKEFWKEAPQAIEELKEGEVLVTRIVKDGQLRVVFWNEIKLGDEICFGRNSLIRGIRWRCGMTFICWRRCILRGFRLLQKGYRSRRRRQMWRREMLGTATETSEDHEYTFEGRDWPFERLWEEMIWGCAFLCFCTYSSSLPCHGRTVRSRQCPTFLLDTIISCTARRQLQMCVLKPK